MFKCSIKSVKHSFIFEIDKKLQNAPGVGREEG